jgi:LmbE family N-acetylglucosaminyl deacetylase
MYYATTGKHITRNTVRFTTVCATTGKKAETIARATDSHGAIKRNIEAIKAN